MKTVTVQIAKRRSTNFGLTTKAKSYKHLEFFYHTQIKAVVEFSSREGNDYHVLDSNVVIIHLCPVHV